MLSCPACRPPTPTTAPPRLEPAAADELAPSDEEEADRQREPTMLVAAVDGLPILEADVARYAKHWMGVERPPPTRADLVLALVERRLLEKEAQSLGITVDQERLERELAKIAGKEAMSVEGLRETIEGDTSWTWGEYRGEIAARMLETEVLTARFDALQGERLDMGIPPGFEARRRIDRARLVGCRRAQANIVVHDEEMRLPQNPYASPGTIAALRFTTDTVLPPEELEDAAASAIADASLCDAIPAVVIALERHYISRGYLEARVSIPWPESPRPEMTIDVVVEPGAPYVFGEIHIDQEDLFPADRMSARVLRRRVRAHVTPGEIVSAAALDAAQAAVAVRMEAAGMDHRFIMGRRKDGDRWVLDLTVRPLPRHS